MKKLIIITAALCAFLKAETAGGQSGRLNYVSLESFFVQDFLIGVRYARDLFEDVPVQAGASFYLRPYKKTFIYPADKEISSIFGESQLDVQVREKRIMVMLEASSTPFFTERFGLSLGTAWVLSQGWYDGVSLYDNFLSGFSAYGGVLIGVSDNFFLGAGYRFLTPYVPGMHFATVSLTGVF